MFKRLTLAFVALFLFAGCPSNHGNNKNIEWDICGHDLLRKVFMITILFLFLLSVAGCGTGGNGAECKTVEYEGKEYQECLLNGGYTCNEIGQPELSYGRCHPDEPQTEDHTTTTAPAAY